MKITDIKIELLNGQMPKSLVALPAGAVELGNIPIQHIYIRILTDEGITELYGPIDKGQAFHIQTQLRHILIGQDPLAGEKIWDEMTRRFHRHGRTGIFMVAISAIDNGLWDLRGKYYNVPVYRLLGGPTREKIRVYASMLGCSTQTDMATKHAQTAKEMGYTAQKWFFPWWPKGTPSEMMQDINGGRKFRDCA